MEECQSFFDGYGEVRRALLISGRGFDPRMTFGVKILLGCVPKMPLDTMLLSMNDFESPADKRLQKASDENAATVRSLLNGLGSVTEPQVAMSRREGAVVKRIGARKAADIFTFDTVAPYTDVFVDISALPRGLYISLIGKLLNILDEAALRGEKKPSLFVFVAESSTLDMHIREHLEEHAEYVTFFQGMMAIEGGAQLPKVWFPTLGERQHAQLSRLHEFIAPQEICPVLPMPSRSPRRADNLIRDYATLLFETWQVSPSNFIYVAEQNPFEAYRQLVKAVRQYRLALAPLGGSCKIVLSTLSSKLLSIGSLLAAYEFKMTDEPIAIAHVEAASYSLPKSSEVCEDAVPYLMMISGDAYEI